MARGKGKFFPRIIEPDLTAHILASVNAGPMNEDTGHYTELVYSGIDDMERADRIRKNLFNAALRLQIYSVTAKIEPAGKGYAVRYTVIDKKKAREYILNKYQGHPEQMPYNPWKGK